MFRRPLDIGLRRTTHLLFALILDASDIVDV
jgi:hypothetical protein